MEFEEPPPRYDEIYGRRNEGNILPELPSSSPSQPLLHCNGQVRQPHSTRTDTATAAAAAAAAPVAPTSRRGDVAAAATPAAGQRRATPPLHNNHFNMTQCLMLWTGAGRCCWCWPLMLLYLSTCGFGVTILYYAIKNVLLPDVEVSSLLVTCFLSAVAFIMCCLLWCCILCATQVKRTDCCRQQKPDPSTNYTLLSCATWAVVIFFMAVSVAALVSVIDFYSGNYSSCSFTTEGLFENVYCMQLVVCIVMWCVMAFCAFWNFACYSGCRETVGFLYAT